MSAGRRCSIRCPENLHEDSESIQRERNCCVTAVTPDVLTLAERLWAFHRIEDDVEAADVIVGLGSYDLRVPAQCAALYLSGVAPHIVFCGALSNWTRRVFDKAEALVFADVAREHGVPADCIHTETASTNIGENLRNTRALTRDWDVECVLLVTKPQTTRRAIATQRRQWPEVQGYVTSPPTTFATQPTEAFPLELLINEMVGDVQRLQAYPERGYQVDAEVPADIVAAAERLLALGFDKHQLRT